MQPSVQLTKEEREKYYPGEGYVRGSDKERGLYKLAGALYGIGQKKTKGERMGQKWGRIGKGMGKKAWWDTGWLDPALSPDQPPSDPNIMTQAETSWIPSWLTGYNP